MRILLISYGNIEYDGRLRSLISVFSQLGELNCFLGSDNTKSCITKRKSNYLTFIIKAVTFAKKLETIDILVLDNRKATIPGLIIRRFFHPKIIIQDCREFYRLNAVKHLTGKIGCIFEWIGIKRADIIIAANKERATLMQKEYGLMYKPLVYENLRKLEYESEYSIVKAKEKIDPLLGEDCIRIVSTSGCDIKRTNDLLVKNLPKIDKKVRLFLVGSNNQEDEKKIRALIATLEKNEAIITGKLNQSELKYLITQCKIGIVNYGQYDMNNKYCASGKLFEFVYEGLPVVTTSNPPLKALCRKYGIGEVDDEYYNGINAILNNYNMYKTNALDFAKEHTIEENNIKLVCDIKERLENMLDA